MLNTTWKRADKQEQMGYRKKLMIIKMWLQLKIWKMSLTLCTSSVAVPQREKKS